eukprot:scaffold193_cov255-Pinguiococcus_pyrenoidosus.AAC.40
MGRQSATWVVLSLTLASAWRTGTESTEISQEGWLGMLWRVREQLRVTCARRRPDVLQLSSGCLAW